MFQFYYNYYHQYSYNFESPPEMYFYRDGVFCKIGIKSEDVLFPPIYVFECNYQHILVGKAYLTYKLQGASPCYWRDVFFYKDSLVILNELSKELEYSIQHYVWSAKEASLFLAQCEKAGTAEDCGPLRDAYVFYGSVFKRLVLDSLDLLFEINKNYYSDQFSEEFYWLSCNVRDRIYISLNESLDLLRGCPFFRFACPSKDFDIKGFLGKQNLYEDKLRWNYYYLTPTEFQTQREEILRLSILELWFEYGDFTGLTLRDHFLFNNLIGSEKNNCLENNYSLSFDRDFLERKFMFK